MIRTEGLARLLQVKGQYHCHNYQRTHRPFEVPLSSPDFRVKSCHFIFAFVF